MARATMRAQAAPTYQLATARFGPSIVTVTSAVLPVTSPLHWRKKICFGSLNSST